jgi:hypothetical protein
MAGFEVTLYGRICGDHRGYRACCSNTRFRWALARDGKRFLLVSLVFGVASEPATVVLNWQSGLKK